MAGELVFVAGSEFPGLELLLGGGLLLAEGEAALSRYSNLGGSQVFYSFSADPAPAELEPEHAAQLHHEQLVLQGVLCEELLPADGRSVSLWPIVPLFVTF